ncbi:hypothetical protein T440DRAFT_383516 [Plenodomus tracheiphilus IPT5]|uniref:Cenp-O kinetochore centromere component n=1 Tax=Plenodomus tracheiphilus IPT5 TaxID=1408161 RepID=A0A6A7BM70_9PLEO|nr:hypothetical protein T440DRAFT_383516 [Plenodomus tracheiphilus IPT5]
METTESLDADITALHTRLATLHAHRANLSSILLSQPHLSTHLQLATNNKHSTKSSTSTAHDLITQQATRNTTNIYRACAGVTAYKVQDPDPNAINGGAILGISIDVSLGGKFIETYHVLLNYREHEGKKVLRVHKHTIPPCIPLQQLANKWLPVGGRRKDGEVAEDTEQDLVRFGRALRREVVGWHLRVDALGALKKEAGVEQEEERRDGEVEESGRVLNAFVSDDEASSDVEEEEEGRPVKIVDVEADASVRQITVRWSDRRTAVMNITKDGRVDKAVCRLKDGSRDVAAGRKAIGPMIGLMRRLAA